MYLCFVESRYRNNPTVIGIDLKNEPSSLAGWDNWKSAIEDCANAIHRVNPGLLIIAQGLCDRSRPEYGNWWWSGNLQEALVNPITIHHENKLVYGVNDFPASIYPIFRDEEDFSDTPYPEILPSIWKEHWRNVMTSSVAPVLIGEFGTGLVSKLDVDWLKLLLVYLQESDFNETRWSQVHGNVTLYIQEANHSIIESMNNPTSWFYWGLTPNRADTLG